MSLENILPRRKPVTARQMLYMAAYIKFLKVKSMQTGGSVYQEPNSRIVVRKEMSVWRLRSAKWASCLHSSLNRLHTIELSLKVLTMID